VAAQGWDWFFKKRQNNSLHYHFADWNHPATPALRQLLCNGAPVINSAPPWSLRRKDQAMQRGSHPSAKHLYADFLNDEMLDMVNKGYWMVLPYHSLKHHPHLKLSPAGVIPQRNRRPHTIVDCANKVFSLILNYYGPSKLKATPPVEGRRRRRVPFRRRQ
jgi:hypothetical protein